MFEIGDRVYGSDWCYPGVIIDINDEVAVVKFETAGGGGNFFFYFDELEKAD